MSTAFVQRPAPAFKATTVFPGGEFKDISLSDYLGQWYVGSRCVKRGRTWDAKLGTMLTFPFHQGRPPLLPP